MPFRLYVSPEGETEGEGNMPYRLGVSNEGESEAQGQEKRGVC